MRCANFFFIKVLYLFPGEYTLYRESRSRDEKGVLHPDCNSYEDEKNIDDRNKVDYKDVLGYWRPLFLWENMVEGKTF